MISSKAAAQLLGNKLNMSKMGVQPGQRGYIKGVDGKEIGIIVFGALKRG